jgi:hypothetical protein
MWESSSVSPSASPEMRDCFRSLYLVVVWFSNEEKYEAAHMLVTLSLNVEQL